MNKVYLILLLVGLEDSIYFLRAEFINLREFPSSGRDGDTPSYLIYKEIKSVFCLTKYITCYASYFPFHTIFKSFSPVKILRTTEEKMNKKVSHLGQVEQERTHGHVV